MAKDRSSLPENGLYRTTVPLAGHEERVRAGLLVRFCRTSPTGLPQVLLPVENVHNSWQFADRGYTFRTLSWAQTLLRLPREGFYMLSREVNFDGGAWPEAALVQLGYTRDAEAILFIAQRRSLLDENDLLFGEQGVPIADDQLAALRPLSVYAEPKKARS